MKEKNSLAKKPWDANYILCYRGGGGEIWSPLPHRIGNNYFVLTFFPAFNNCFLSLVVIFLSFFFVSCSFFICLSSNFRHLLMLAIMALTFYRRRTPLKWWAMETIIEAYCHHPHFSVIECSTRVCDNEHRYNMLGRYTWAMTVKFIGSSLGDIFQLYKNQPLMFFIDNVALHAPLESCDKLARIFGCKIVTCTFPMVF